MRGARPIGRAYAATAGERESSKVAPGPCGRVPVPGTWARPPGPTPPAGVKVRSDAAPRGEGSDCAEGSDRSADVSLDVRGGRGQLRDELSLDLVQRPPGGV